MPNGPCTDKMWAMSLDKLGTRDGSRTKCILVIQNNEPCMISCFLKSKVTNYDVEAVALNT